MFRKKLDLTIKKQGLNNRNKITFVMKLLSYISNYARI